MKYMYPSQRNNNNKKSHFNRHQIEHFIESDNPGSTDSEVRKILTLHIPITEYDTLGSESDNDVASRAMNQAKYRPQRGIYQIFTIIQ